MLDPACFNYSVFLWFMLINEHSLHTCWVPGRVLALRMWRKRVLEGLFWGKRELGPGAGWSSQREARASVVMWRKVAGVDRGSGTQAARQMRWGVTGGWGVKKAELGAPVSWSSPCRPAMAPRVLYLGCCPWVGSYRTEEPCSAQDRKRGCLEPARSCFRI